MPRSQEGGGASCVGEGEWGSPAGRATLSVNMGVMAVPGSGSASRVDTLSGDVGACLPTRGMTARGRHRRVFGKHRRRMREKEAAEEQVDAGVDGGNLVRRPYQTNIFFSETFFFFVL